MTWQGLERVLRDKTPLLSTLLQGKGAEKIGVLLASTLHVRATPQAVKRQLQEYPEDIELLKTLEVKHIYYLQQQLLEHSFLDNKYLLTQKKLQMLSFFKPLFIGVFIYLFFMGILYFLTFEVFFVSVQDIIFFSTFLTLVLFFAKEIFMYQDYKKNDVFVRKDGYGN